MKILNIISNSYLYIAISALIFGIGVPQISLYLAPYITIFLAIIFFFSALEINLNEILLKLKDGTTLFWSLFFMLLLLPAGVYFVTNAFFPMLAIPFLLLAAMPVGMTAPLLTEIVGGNRSTALVLTVATSLLAPFTVPFVIKLLAGTQISISAFEMGKSLALVIFIPFLIAQPIKYWWKHTVVKVEKYFKPTSTLLLGLLIAGVAAKQADYIISGLATSNSIIFILVALFVLFIVFHLFGYFAFFWKNHQERITITISMTYMNFTLAIYLADTFFQTQEIILPVILSVIPWAILLSPFKYIAQKIK